jgi:hypothetical protein
MSKHPWFLAAAFAVTLHLAAAAPAEAQTLASIGAVGIASTGAAEKTPGCWGCYSTPMGYTQCIGGVVPGYWNCANTTIWNTGCQTSSPGCGQGAMLPLDPDGAVQYVSRGAAIGLGPALEQAGENVRRNCEGVVVARFQAPDNIAAVRVGTTTLTL